MTMLNRQSLIRSGARWLAALAALPTLLRTAAAAADDQPATDDQVDLLAESVKRCRELEEQIVALECELDAITGYQRGSYCPTDRPDWRNSERELAQARERAEQQKGERMKYLRQRDEARRLAIRLHRGESVTLPEWAEHPYYGGVDAAAAR